MNFDEETLQEIEDYIEALDESVGLRPDTMFDVNEAIGRQRRKLKILNIDSVIVSVCECENLTGELAFKCDHCGEFVDWVNPQTEL